MNTQKRTLSPTVRLTSGYDMPLLGLGTYKAHGTCELMLEALDLGYRLLDTAWIYDNEKDVGEALAHTTVPREELFVATKVWPNHFTRDLTKRSIDRSLKDLQVDYLDMVYLHWWGEGYLDAWHVLEDYRAQGIIRTLSVSNFTQKMLEELFKQTDIRPACDQIEIHPLWPETELVNYLHTEHIQPVAYCPIARAKVEVMGSDAVLALAKKYGKSPVQIVLRWQLDRGIAPIPKTVHAERLPENLAVFDFALTEDEVSSITALEQADGKISHMMADPAWLEKCAHDPL